MSATTDVLTRDNLIIGGEWVAPAGTGPNQGANPAPEQRLAPVPRRVAGSAGG